MTKSVQFKIVPENLMDEDKIAFTRAQLRMHDSRVSKQLLTAQNSPNGWWTMSIFRQLTTFATSYVSAETFQQQFGAREVCRASQSKWLEEKKLYMTSDITLFKRMAHILLSSRMANTFMWSFSEAGLLCSPATMRVCTGRLICDSLLSYQKGATRGVQRVAGLRPGIVWRLTCMMLTELAHLCGAMHISHVLNLLLNIFP